MSVYCQRCREDFKPGDEMAEVYDKTYDDTILMHAECMYPGEEIA